MKNFKNVNTERIKSGAPLTTVAEQVKELTVDRLTVGEHELPWVQGGVCDGRYLYQFIVSRDSKHCVIVKQDMETLQVVAKSEDMMLGHANDGAYNPNNNTIAIPHCCDLDSPSYNIIYLVDAEKLTLIKTLELPKYDLFTITYNENTRQYITASEEEMHYWDEDFNLLDTKPILITPGWPSQGIECDGEYVYRLEFFLNKKPSGEIIEMKNNMHVNDVTTGEEVALIPVNVPLESEHMFIYNGEFYVVCNNRRWTGSDIFRFKIISE